ncbi:glycosyltransferase family 39 protein [Nucisporomicrobium flavum]|jgi:mannosyltransferase|uniref:glycosyltransferase family 39 protein n=1 Tax=Nucisporomicrobium flavum TaxID=2785915 RepID=UPI0018F407D5|nr:glycosyltransferase family 39 protein [Nucisporomicrobium flavum]
MAADTATGTEAVATPATVQDPPPDEQAPPAEEQAPPAKQTPPSEQEPPAEPQPPAEQEKVQEKPAAEDTPPASPPPSRAGRTWAWMRTRLIPTLALVTFPFAATLTVMLINIGTRQLWRDENATWWAASLDLADLREMVQTLDVVLYPYYAFMHGWVTLFGDSETALRMPAALAMAFSAAVIALIGRRLFDARAGLIAGLLMPAVPVISRYGQEARPYALAMLATVTAVWLLLRAVERPTVWRWIPYALAVIAIGCSHIVALMSLAAHLVVVVAAVIRARGRKRLWTILGWPLSVVAAVLAVSPLIIRGQVQGAQINWIPDTTWERVQAFPGEVFMSPAVAGFFLTAGLGAIFVLAFEGRGGLLLVWALLPPIVAYYTFHEYYFFYPRYLLFTVPAWILLAGFALRRLASAAGSGRVAATAKVVVVVVAAAAGLTFAGWTEQGNIRSDAEPDEFAFRLAAGLIAARDEPGDGIIFTGYRYAHRGFRYEWRHQPREQQPQEILVDQPPDEAWSWEHPPCLPTAVCLADTKRIWLVSTDPGGLSPFWPLPGYQQKAVQRRYDIVLHVEFHRVWVTELVRKPPRK